MWIMAQDGTAVNSDALSMIEIIGRERTVGPRALEATFIHPGSYNLAGVTLYEGSPAQCAQRMRRVMLALADGVQVLAVENGETLGGGTTRLVD